MKKKDYQDFGRLLLRVNLSPYQRHQLIESLPYLSEKKLKQIYAQLKKIYTREHSLSRSIRHMRADVKSGKIKAAKSFEQ